MGIEKFAIAISLKENWLIVQTYQKKEQIETCYKKWYELAVATGINKPVPLAKTEDNT